MRVKLILLSSILASSFLSAEDSCQLPWQSRHAEGWAWYHDFQKSKNPSTQESIQKDPIVILKTAKEALERALAHALLDPTEENILSYLTLQKEWVEKASVFSRFWQQAILEHPELASMIPTTQYGVQVRKEVDLAERKLLIQNLAKTNILLFFYEGASTFSQAFAKVVNEFSSQYNWTVKGVSVDSVVLKSFPMSITDSSLADEMDVKNFPSLFLIDLKTQEATPIAFGLAAISQIEENIVLQFEDNE